jgi:hypothetical protein
LRQEETGVWLQRRQYLGKDGKLEFHKAMPQLMTSWGLPCRAMRTAFLAEDYVEGDAPAWVYIRLGGLLEYEPYFIEHSSKVV